MRMMIYVILMVDEWSAPGQSDSNLEHKGQAVADTRTKSDSNLGCNDQAVADTRINRLTRWFTESVSHLFCDIMKIENVYQSKTGDALQKWQ